LVDWSLTSLFSTNAANSHIRDEGKIVTIRFALCCHSNTTRAPNANPPNSAQLGGIPYHSVKLHLGPCNSVDMRPRTDTQTDRQTHTQTRVTTIHFASSTTHAKCNHYQQHRCRRHRQHHYNAAIRWRKIATSAAAI